MEEKKMEMKVTELIIEVLELDGINSSDVDIDISIFDEECEEVNGFCLDSIDAVELMIKIQKEFEIKLDDTFIKNITSIRSIANYIKKIKEIK